MSDLFHKDVPLAFIQKVFDTMNNLPHHTFQVLTKRADRLAELSNSLIWTKNIWMGVSVENQKAMERIDFLKATTAKVKFLSIEPLIEALPNLDLQGIHWVIVGGESGKGAIRPMNPIWVHDIKNACEAQNVPFFFKQWGGKNKKLAGRLLDGKTYDNQPIIHH